MSERIQPIRDEDGTVCGEIVACTLTAREGAAPLILRVAQIVAPATGSWPLVYIHMMNVVPAKCGRGIGTAALLRFLADTFHEGTCLVLLHVGQFDATTARGREKAFRLRGWYQRIGFTEVVSGGISAAIADPLMWAKHGEMTWMYMLPPSPRD